MQNDVHTIMSIYSLHYFYQQTQNNMAGEGFMAHANQSIKMNRRAKGDFLAMEDQVSATYADKPLHLQKASPKKLQEIEARNLQLQQAESRRLKAVWIVVVLTIVGLVRYFG